ncbi:rhombosortase [Rheinheimera fenheensis]|uniref:rhombosortase n=1 Tax=Rheinheimera fenheensis TaxID=3152295 RepID=UPI00325D7384
MPFILAPNTKVYAALAICMLLLALIPDNWQLALQYQRSALEQGQLWRTISGHLLHANHWHLLLNLAGLLLVLLLHGRYFCAHQLLLQWLVFALAISALLYLFSSNIYSYVGLSGVLHAMLTLGAIKDVQHAERSGYLLLAGLIAKVAYEQWQGPDAELTCLIGADVAIDAHLYGVISGVLVAILLYIKNLAQR